MKSVKRISLYTLHTFAIAIVMVAFLCVFTPPVYVDAQAQTSAAISQEEQDANAGDEDATEETDSADATDATDAGVTPMDDNIVTIGAAEIPLTVQDVNIADSGGWSIINLALTGLSLLLAVLMIVYILFLREKKATSVLIPSSRINLIAFALTLILAICNVILFLTTQEIGKTMLISDGWTSLCEVIVIVEVVVMSLSYRRMEINKTKGDRN